jgi:hypothetical protein
MIVGEEFNREGAERRRERKIFILRILRFRGVALAARETRNPRLAREVWSQDNGNSFEGSALWDCGDGVAASAADGAELFLENRMKKQHGGGFVMDALEGRQMLSFGGGHFGGFGGLGRPGGDGHVPGSISDNQDPAVQADLVTIQADKQKLQDDFQTLSPTLQADRQAISDAIKGIGGNFDTLRQTFRSDAQTWRAKIQDDITAIRADRQSGDTEQLAADKATLLSDRQAARTALKADSLAIKSTINNDDAVQAAKQKLQDDSQPLKDDQDKLRTDFMQLRTDIQAARAAKDGTGGQTT